MIRWIASKLAAAGRLWTIYNQGEPYLERYYVAFRDRRGGDKPVPFNIFLHHFIKSDSPVWHTHPFNYVSIILKGGYWEHKLDSEGFDTVRWRGPGSIIFSRKRKMMTLFRYSYGDQPEMYGEVPANAHWLELDPDKDTWSLFFRGRKADDVWRFYPDPFKPGIYWEDWITGRRTP